MLARLAGLMVVGRPPGSWRLPLIDALAAISWVRTIASRIPNRFMPATFDVPMATALARRAALAFMDDLPKLRKFAVADNVGEHLLARVKVAAEHANGCALLGDAGLAAPLAVVCRALLEGVFGTYWASLDDANGRVLIEATNKELTRVMLRDLEAGHATIRDRITGEDRTAEIRRHPASARAERLPRFDYMAKAAGLGRIYDVLYRPMSLFSHGAGVELLSSDGRDSFLHSQLHAASALVGLGHLVVANRLRNGRITSIAEVGAMLKVPT